MAPEILCGINEMDHCKSHEWVVKTMTDLKEVSAKLAEGQSQILSIVEGINRLTQRVEKLELNQDDIKKFIYKVAGIIGAIGVSAPIIITLLQKGN